MHKFRFGFTRTTDWIYERRWLLLSIAVLSVILGVVRLRGQQVLQENPDPHENAACSPRGSSKEVPCECLGMVGEVQRQLSARCWEEAGLPGPPPEIKGVEPPVPPPAVMECLGRVPSHCDIISKIDPWSYWTVVVPQWVKQLVQTRKWPKNACATRCFRDRCGCVDSHCSPESGSGEEY